MAIKSPSLLFRNFTSADLLDATMLANSSLSEFYSESLISELRDQWPEAFMVCYSGSELIGLICGSKYSRTEARVLLLAVKRESRRLGIGGILMERFENLARSSGYIGVTLEVKKDNVGAINFYRRIGYSITGSITAYYSDLSDAYVMWKLL